MTDFYFATFLSQSCLPWGMHTVSCSNTWGCTAGASMKVHAL
jgi:hypothetical protein